MLSDGREVPDGAELIADVCVVGAGAAGITLARDLAGTTLRVLMVESGGLGFEEEVQDLYRGTSTGLPYFPLDTSRLRYLGGSTNHWAGFCRPWDAIDFTARPDLPLSGWPLSREDLDDYYARASSVVGLAVGRFDLDYWTAQDRLQPLDLSPDRIVTVVDEIVPQASRSFGTRYRKDLEAAQNVEVLMHANAVEIETTATARHVERVHLATLTGRRFSVRATAVVIATGGIENARLLLASNRVQPGGVGNDHDLVGRCFLEHPRFVAGTWAPPGRTLTIGFYTPHAVGGSATIAYLVPPAELMRAEGLVNVQIRLEPVYNAAIQAALNGQDAAALRDLLAAVDELPASFDDEFRGHVVRVAEDLSTWQDATVPGGPLAVPLPEVMGEIVQAASTGQLDAAVPLLLGDVATVGVVDALRDVPVERVDLVTRIAPAPNLESRVLLGAERDALGMPRAELHWELSEIDRRSAIRAVEILAAELGRNGLGRVQLRVDDEDPWPRDLAGAWHQMGTTRMSDDPARGVVDRDLLVHGIDNLYVTGSSVFPTAGLATPTLLIVALTLRLSEHLRGALS